MFELYGYVFELCGRGHVTSSTHPLFYCPTEGEKLSGF